MDNEKLHTQAIITLVLGILSLVLLLFGWSSIVGLGCGIAALIIGSKVKKASENKEGLGNAGYICGLIGTILSAIEMIILIIVLFFFGATFNFIKNQQPDVDQAKKLIDTIKDYADEYDEKENKKEEVEDTTTTTTTVQSSSSSTNSEELSKLKAQLDEKTAKVSELRQKITNLTTEMQNAIRSGDTNTMTSYQSQIRELQTEISTLVSEITSIERQIAALE